MREPVVLGLILAHWTRVEGPQKSLWLEALHWNRQVSLQTDDVTVAGTHLNVCAILSKLDKHDKAGLWLVSAELG